MAKSKNRDIVIDNFPSTPELKVGVNHLLAIGIDDYQHVAKLSNAVRDAKAFVQLMQDKYDFSAENTYTLYDGDACKHKITATFREIIDKVDKVKDNLVVYFSGHGHYDQLLKEGYWVPTDAQFKAEVDYISYSYIKKVVKAIPSHHTVMIVDSCYSGSVLMGSRDLMADRVERDPSRWMLASGRNEVVPDGVIGGNSPFAENLLNILERYSDQGLRLGKLVEKLTTAVSYNSKQTPIGRPMYEVGDQGGEFYFHPKQTPEKAWAKAQSENSIAAYTFFLAKHSDSQFASAAEAKLKQLQTTTPPVGIQPQADIAINTVPQVSESAPAVRALGTMSAKPTAAAPASNIGSSSISKKQLIIYGGIALALILAGIFGYIRSENSKAKRYTLEGMVLFSEGKFQDALEKGETALLSVHDYDDAKQLTTKASKGISAQAFFQRGLDSLKYNSHDEALHLFGEARIIYDDISYPAGSNEITKAIENAKTSKIRYEEEEAMRKAESKAEKQRIHENFQQMQKDSADLYFIQGNYAHAYKIYQALDDTLSIANELVKARLGAAGKLPAMVEVKVHNGSDFYMGKYEVTNKQFCAFLNANGSHQLQGKTLININKSYTGITKNGKYIVSPGMENRPVTGVSWYGARAFCNWAGGQLPSPEQWEFAARGGVNNSQYSFSGSNKIHEVAFYFSETRPFPEAGHGELLPNELGIYNMSGNAWEWTSNKRSTSPKQSIMGGSINKYENKCKVNSSQQLNPSRFGGENNNDLGFRMIRMAPKQTISEAGGN